MEHVRGKRLEGWVLGIDFVLIEGEVGLLVLLARHVCGRPLWLQATLMFGSQLSPTPCPV